MKPRQINCLISIVFSEYKFVEITQAYHWNQPALLLPASSWQKPEAEQQNFLSWDYEHKI